METVVETPSIKDVVRNIADGLADDATWDDVEYQLLTAKKVLRGLADIRAGRTHTLEEVRAELGLDPLCE